MKKQTASQTVGPFFSIGMIDGKLNNMVSDHTAGKQIFLRGHLLDGNGDPINDAVIELWQADANGIYNHPQDVRQAEADSTFFGFGRAATDDHGAYWFKTIKPGSVAGMSPHLNVRIFMRGLLLHVVTRIYFPDEDNSTDPILAAVPPSRQQTLITQQDDREGTPTYWLDFRMQGENETVFFEP